MSPAIRLMALLLACSMLTGCTAQQTTSEQSGSSASVSASSAPGESSSGDAQTGSSQSDSSQLPLDSSSEQTITSYDFSKTAPQSDPVEDDYFADAAFVGDSRTDGLLIYGGMKQGTNLTSNGLSIFELDKEKVLTVEGEKYTLLEALALKQYGKVYLSLGVNELGYNDDQGFYDAYCDCVDAIRACQPDAVIYIQGLIPLNEDVIKNTGGRTYLKNEHLRVYNDLMLQVAQEKQVVFLDLYPQFVQADGQLAPQASNDGIHLKKDYCVQWMDYLRSHTVSYETLYPAQGETAKPVGEGQTK